MDLYNELNDLQKQLDVSIKSLRNTGRDYAKSFTDYRIAISKELINLKSQGMAITLAGDVARGKPEIAHLKYKEICDEAIYIANKEAINAIKLRIRIIQAQIDKEYGNANE